MVNIVFLDPTVFNVLKYLLFSLTVGCAADIVLETFVRYDAARALLNKGGYCPAPPRVRLRPVATPATSNASRLVLFAIILLAAALEMMLDFSAGATSIWTTTTKTFRISQQVSNVTQLSYSTADYISQVHHALQRVEGTCFNIYDRWYSPISFNLSNSHEFFDLGNAALCMQNRSMRVNAMSAIEDSSFNAADILATKIWNGSQITIGRDSDSEEEQVPYDQVGDVSIGALEKYSFVAANITANDLIEGSERQITGNTSHHSPWAFSTALYRTQSGQALECLVAVNWKRDKETNEWTGKKLVVQVCLVPIAGNRSVLGLYDDVIDAAGEQALVMSVALKGAITFHDLNVLKAVPFLMGRNNRMHTNRELAILAVLCTHMITAFSTDGLRDVRMDVDGELVTVPTWNLWGMVLLVVGMVILMILKVVGNTLSRKLRVRGSLVTAKGIAEHWLCEEEHFEDGHEGKGRVLLVANGITSDRRVTIGVKREGKTGERQIPDHLFW